MIRDGVAKVASATRHAELSELTSNLGNALIAMDAISGAGENVSDAVQNLPGFDVVNDLWNEYAGEYMQTKGMLFYPSRLAITQD